MSTKTTFKRIALVAVASLGFGMLTVAPSSAVAGDQAALTDFDAAAITVAQNSSRVGVNVNLTAGFTHNAAVDEDDIYYFKAALSKPAGSTVQPTLTFSTHTDSTNVVAGDFAATAATSSSLAKLAYTVGTAGDAADNEVLTVASQFTPDVAGTYVYTTWFDFDNDDNLDSGETSASKTFVVSSAAPALALTSYGSPGVAAAAANGGGVLVRVALTSGGVAASLAGNETIAISASSNKTYAAGTTTEKTTLFRDDFDEDGYAWISVQGTTAGTVVVTFAGAAGTGVAGINTSTSVTLTAATATGTKEVGAFAYSNLTGVTVDGTPTTDQVIVAYGKTTSVTFEVTGAATATSTAFGGAEVVAATITDTDGTITGKAGSVFTRAVTLTAGEGSFALSFNLVSNITDLDATVSGTTGDTSIATVAVTDATNDADVNETLTIQTFASLSKGFTMDYTSLRALNSSTVTIEGVLKDQFGIVMNNVAVTATPSGRNAGVAVVQNMTTNSLGRFSFTYTDAPLAANATTTTDTWAIASAGTQSTNETGGAYAAGSVSVTFAADLGVSTVTLGGGNTTAGVTSTIPSNKDISAGDGVQAVTQPITATIKDANGAILVGVPVTWTVSGTGAAILSTKATTWTGAAGTTPTSVYGWIAGTYTVTATAGGKTGTATISFAQTAAGEERTISASVSGPIVTAKVVDRFGNPVPLVTVYATKTGAGYFGDGKLKTTGTTDSAGEISFVVAGGDAEVTVATYDISVVGAQGSGQTCARAGVLTCAEDAADDTAMTAFTAGTATVAEKGVGNSAAYTAAGVASAKVSVTGVNAATQAATAAAEAAADAAAEAIDAANAATDAANLAAEAADAATVAAEEARDAADAATAAVEELATQVATLMAALKAQITTLANTVAKIAKKVKA